MAEEVKPKYPGANCGECPYLKNTAFVPPSKTAKPPKLLVLGEAPGQNEARTGIPFTGPSGQLLTGVLDHYGIDSRSVVKNNVALCRPYGPTEKPPKKVIECCSDRLHKEIQDSGIEYILAVGNTAASAVLDDKRTITHVRVGSPKPYKYDPKIQVVASVHPAFCLRSPDNFPTFVKDVGKLVTPPKSGWKPPTYKVFEDPEVARKALQQLIKHTERAVIDIEVGVEKDFDYAHPEDYAMLCVGFAYDKGKAVVFGKSAMPDQGVRELMSEYFATKILGGWNAKFDFRGLAPLVGIHRFHFDGMLKSRALDERPGNHGLKNNAVEILGAPKYDDNIKKYIPRGGSYADVPLKILYEYNAYDVACTWDIDEFFDTQMDARARQEHQFMVDAANTLIHLELAGINFDHVYNQELAKEYLAELEQFEEKLDGIIGHHINPRSPKQITDYFLSKNLRIDTTNAEFLAEIKEVVKDVEVIAFINELLAHRKLSKLYGTYVKGLANKTTNNKTYTVYTLHGTTSGRLASKNPNMQNIAKNERIRNQFVVEHPDNRLIQIDYSQIEGRVIAAYAQDYYLAGIFNDANRDLFNELIFQIYGDKKVYDARRKIKSVWYGFSYGRKAKSISKELDIPFQEAHELVEGFKQIVPATVTWQEAIKRKVLTDQELVTSFGRKRTFHLITNENKEDVLNEALSFMPQSTASDICVSALIVLKPMLAELATIRLTIHDALVFEAHHKNVDQVIEIASREMIAAATKFTTFTRFAVDATVGTRLGEI